MTAVQLAAPNGALFVDRALTWMGETLTGLADNAVATNSQTFTYTPAHRLATATGSYGSYTWTYDAVGNRTSEQLGSVVSTYAYPTTSNRLSSITSGNGAPRVFGYDAAGATTTDSRSGPASGGTYTYDFRSRLSSRTVTQSAALPSTTALYIHDLADHIVAELDAAGQTQREYIWLDDMPVAVVDGVASGTPTIYYVHVDHLMRPVRMTAQDWTRVWEAKYAPFGATTVLVSTPAVMNLRFPGQWFQLETGLAYNWHRASESTLAMKSDRGSARTADPARATATQAPKTRVHEALNRAHRPSRHSSYAEHRMDAPRFDNNPVTGGTETPRV